MRPLALTPAVLLLVAVLVACRGYTHDTGPFETCDTSALEPGRVRALRMPCDDMGVDGGEGRRADYLLDNAYARFVIRQPGASATLLDLAGGTLIDAAPPGGSDGLAELVPLVGGGWLESLELEIEQGDDEAVIRVRGRPAPISFIDADAPLAPWAEIVYRLGAEDRALRIEGADAFWLLPQADARRFGSVLEIEGALLGMDGRLEDRGGGLLVQGATRLATGSASAVMEALWPGAQAVSGSTLGDQVELLAGAETVGWLPVGDDGTFEGTPPLQADGLRALAQGHAPGPVVAMGTELELPLGAEGWLGVRAVDRQGRPQPVLLEAVGPHGARVVTAVEPDGSWVGLGAGRWQLSLDAGPLYERQRREISLDGSRKQLELVLEGRGAPAGWALADLMVEAWPSREDRTSPARALAQAAARGVRFAVLGAPDEVATVALWQPWDHRLRATSGSWAASDAQGRVLAWPVSSNRRKPAHGAVSWSGLGAEDILRVAQGGAGQHRLLAVDAAWLEAAGPSFAWDPRPDMLRLEVLEDLELALTLYDSWVPVTLCGPSTWVWLGHDDPFAVEEIERSLLRGATVAGTGPFLDLQVDGASPGERLTGRQPRLVRLAVHAPPDQELEGAALIVDGVWIQSWDLRGGMEELRFAWHQAVSTERYVMAVAWGPGDGPGQAWAATGPVWTGRP
jgi:hypothetical protein